MLSTQSLQSEGSAGAALLAMAQPMCLASDQCLTSPSDAQCTPSVVAASQALWAFTARPRTQGLSPLKSGYYNHIVAYMASGYCSQTGAPVWVTLRAQMREHKTHAYKATGTQQ